MSRPPVSRDVLVEFIYDYGLPILVAAYTAMITLILLGGASHGG